MSGQMRFEGTIGVFYPNKNWGFISVDTAGVRRSGPGLFFHERDLRGDWRGSVAWGKIPGTPVTFKTKRNPSTKYPGQTLVSADDVAPIFEEPATESLDTYREVSRVRTWNGKFGTLARDCGSELFFHRSAILQDDRASRLQIGDLVFHGVGQRDDDRWRAIEIQLYSAGEQERLQQGLPAYEVESEPIIEPISDLLSPINRQKTLLELIKENQSPR